MSELKLKYQQWLAALNAELSNLTSHPVDTLAQWHSVISDYLQAGADLTRYETQLFLETFKQQAQSDQQPELWPESLWVALASITDTTKVEWQEFLTDLNHQGVYQAGENVGMGRYLCQHCGETCEYFHPGELRPCSQCQGEIFERRGLPL